MYARPTFRGTRWHKSITSASTGMSAIMRFFHDYCLIANESMKVTLYICTKTFKRGGILFRALELLVTNSAICTCSLAQILPVSGTQLIRLPVTDHAREFVSRDCKASLYSSALDER
jgi:hypothetical protein